MKKLYLLFTLLLHIPLLAEEYNISLKDYSIALNDFNFHVEQVVDALNDKRCIGFVQRGVGNKKVMATLGESITSELNTMLTKSFPKESNKKALIIRVNKILIYEVTYTGKEYAFAELNLTFLSQEGDHYIELFEMGTALNKSSSLGKMDWDVTKFHSDNIMEAIEICFRQFKNMSEQGKLNSTAISATELLKNPLKTRVYPIYAVTEYPKGVYRTFSDFCQNASDSSVAFTVDYNRKKDKINLQWPDQSFNPNSIWGLSDGKDIYMNVDGSFYPIQKEEGNFVVLAPSLNKGNLAFAGVIIAGIIGGILFDELDSSKGKEAKYKVDFSTGSISPFEEPNFKRIEARSIIYFSSFEKEGTQVNVFLNGEEKCVITPGTYYIARTIPSMTSIEVCIESNGEKICKELTPEPFKTAVYLCRMEKKGTPALETPSTGTQQSIWEKIKTGKVQEVCQ